MQILTMDYLLLLLMSVPLTLRYHWLHLNYIISMHLLLRYLWISSHHLLYFVYSLHSLSSWHFSTTLPSLLKMTMCRSIVSGILELFSFLSILVDILSTMYIYIYKIYGYQYMYWLCNIYLFYFIILFVFTFHIHI
jgi:hypothetical protein